MTEDVDANKTPLGDEEERLANLYIASLGIHSSLDLREVVTVILEICLNLVGADRTVFYVFDEDNDRLEMVTAQGKEGDTPDSVALGEGPIGEAVANGRLWVSSGGEGPLAVVPLTAAGHRVGAVVVERLLQQKPALAPLDMELFELLGRQGGLALYGAFLAGAVPKKVTARAFRERLEG